MAAAAEDGQHSVWLSEPERGLLRIQETRVVEVMPWSQFDNKLAWAMEADPQNGGLLLGFSDGVIALYRPGHLVLWSTPAEGLAPGTGLHLHLPPHTPLPCTNPTR